MIKQAGCNVGGYLELSPIKVPVILLRYGVMLLDVYPAFVLIEVDSYVYPLVICGLTNHFIVIPEK
jgi:hypothetical protein